MAPYPLNYNGSSNSVFIVVVRLFSCDCDVMHDVFMSQLMREYQEGSKMLAGKPTGVRMVT